MKKLLMTLLLACTSLICTSGMAQNMTPANDNLYKAFGEKNGITQLMDDFVNRLLKDARIGAHFKDAKPVGLKAQLTDHTNARPTTSVLDVLGCKVRTVIHTSTTDAPSMEIGKNAFIGRRLK